MQQEKYYTDLDLRFNLHPVKKDLIISVNEAAIVRSVKNLVLTSYYERLFQSEIGSNVNKMLFEQISPVTANVVQREIYDVLKIFESRITNLVVTVEMSNDDQSLIANISFYLSNSTEKTIVEILLERTR